MFLTNWGFWCTLFTFALGVYISFSSTYKRESAEDYNYNKWTVAWKHWVLLFEGTLLIEILITLFFWIMLWPILKHKKMITEATPEFFLEVVLAHTMPLALLLIEWMMNAAPFAKRHIVIFLTIGISYLILNIIITFSRDKPVYPVFKWTNTASYVTAVATVIATSLIHVALYYINNCKLGRYARNRN